jgi:hypothetical protein
MAHELCFENGTWFCCHRTQNWQFLYHSHSGTARHFNTGHSSIILFTIVHEKEGASRNCHDYQTRQIIFCSFRRYDLLCFLGGACCHWWMLAYTHIRTNTHTHNRVHATWYLQIAFLSRGQNPSAPLILTPGPQTRPIEPVGVLDPIGPRSERRCCSILLWPESPPCLRQVCVLIRALTRRKCCSCSCCVDHTLHDEFE